MDAIFKICANILIKATKKNKKKQKELFLKMIKNFILSDCIFQPHTAKPFWAVLSQFVLVLHDYSYFLSGIAPFQCPGQ